MLPRASNPEAVASLTPEDEGEESRAAGCVVDTASRGGLVRAVTGVSVNADYNCRYPLKEMKRNYIMLGKFIGLLFLPGQTQLPSAEK